VKTTLTGPLLLALSSFAFGCGGEDAVSNVPYAPADVAPPSGSDTSDAEPTDGPDANPDAGITSPTGGAPDVLGDTSDAGSKAGFGDAVAMLPAPLMRVGPLIPMPLLAPTDPARPFDHSAETTVAAYQGHVVVSAINIHLEVAPLGTAQNKLWRHSAVAVSHDRGETFGPAKKVGEGAQPTDPVVRVGTDGQFWFSSWDWSTNGTTGLGSLQRSTDQGETWTTVAKDLPLIDKEWFAIDDVGKAVFMSAVGGYWKIGFDGDVLGSYRMANGYAAGAFFQGDSAYFVNFRGSNAQITRWNGTGAPVDVGALLDAGEASNVFLYAGKGFGPTTSGGHWILRAVKTASETRVVLRRRPKHDQEGADVPLSKPGEVAFLPAAAIDSQGRLHAVWYETSGAVGRLVYSRSLGPDFATFTAPVVIDPEACPGNGWTPGPAFDDARDRRLREYIDIAIDGSRAHVSWTHAPTTPSRVYASYVDF
jgi:hypothetical protein